MRAHDLLNALRRIAYTLLAVRFVELHPRRVPVPLRVMRPPRG